MEKLSEGGCVFRTIEMEEKVRRKHEEKRQAIMEKLCSQLQAQMEKEEESTSEWSLVLVQTDRLHRNKYSQTPRMWPAVGLDKGAG